MSYKLSTCVCLKALSTLSLGCSLRGNTSMSFDSHHFTSQRRRGVRGSGAAAILQIHAPAQTLGGWDEHTILNNIKTLKKYEREAS